MPRTHRQLGSYKHQSPAERTAVGVTGRRYPRSRNNVRVSEAARRMTIIAASVSHSYASYKRSAESSRSRDPQNQAREHPRRGAPGTWAEGPPASTFFWSNWQDAIHNCAQQFPARCRRPVVSKPQSALQTLTQARSGQGGNDGASQSDLCSPPHSSARWGPAGDQAAAAHTRASPSLE